jgi:hypothetical protein
MFEDQRVLVPWTIEFPNSRRKRRPLKTTIPLIEVEIRRVTMASLQYTSAQAFLDSLVGRRMPVQRLDQEVPDVDHG